MGRSRFLQLLNAVVAVGLAIIVMWTSKPWQVWIFEGRFFGAFFVALIANACLVVVWAYRHSLILRAVGVSIAPKKLVPLVTFSNTANSLTPAASGEVLRVWILNRSFGVELERAGGAIVFERFYMFGFMTLTAATAGLMATAQSLPILLLTGGVLVAYVFLFPAWLTPLALKIPKRGERGGRVRRKLEDSLREGLHLWTDRRTTIGAAGWSLAAFACQGFVFWLATEISGLSLNPLEVWALVGGGTAIGVLSALPFGLGAAELSAAGIGALIGIEAASVAAAFVLYRLFLTLPLALAGSYSYWRLTADSRPAQ